MEPIPEYQIRDGDVVTFRQFADDNRAWSEASLRWLRFNCNENKAAEAGVFIRQGKRVLINKPAFWHWLKSQQQRAA